MCQSRITRTAIVFHFPWWKRAADSTQRVKWPSTIASQIQWRCELAGGLQVEAEAERHADLRDQRDEERAARVAGPLQPAGIGQRDGDEESRHAEIAQQLLADLDDHRIVQAEERQQLLGERAGRCAPMVPAIIRPKRAAT